MPLLLATTLGRPHSLSILSGDDRVDHSDDSLGNLSRSSSLGAGTADDFNPDGVFDTPRDTPPESDDEGAPEDWFDIKKDPLFETSEVVFDRILDTDLGGVLEWDTSLPPAFDEDLLIRNAYVTAYLLAACHGATQETIKGVLDYLFEFLRAMQR